MEEKFFYHGNGYLHFSFCDKKYRVHQVIAELFIPNPENKKYIDHINRNKLDNRIENLRWVSQSENMKNTCRNRKCICIETGKIFNTCKDAEDFYKLKKGDVSNICNPNNKRKSSNNLHFKYWEDTTSILSNKGDNDGQ